MRDLTLTGLGTVRYVSWFLGQEFSLFLPVSFLSLISIHTHTHTKQTLIWHLSGRGTSSFIASLKAAVCWGRKSDKCSSTSRKCQHSLNYPWEILLLCLLWFISEKPHIYCPLVKGFTNIKMSIICLLEVARFLLPDEPCGILGKLSNTSCYCWSSAVVSSSPLEQKAAVHVPPHSTYITSLLQAASSRFITAAALKHLLYKEFSSFLNVSRVTL